jgi:hypothetical protein
MHRRPPNPRAIARLADHLLERWPDELEQGLMIVLDRIFRDLTLVEDWSGEEAHSFCRQVAEEVIGQMAAKVLPVH